MRNNKSCLLLYADETYLQKISRAPSPAIFVSETHVVYNNANFNVPCHIYAANHNSVEARIYPLNMCRCLRFTMNEFMMCHHKCLTGRLLRLMFIMINFVICFLIENVHIGFDPSMTFQNRHKHLAVILKLRWKYVRCIADVLYWTSIWHWNVKITMPSTSAYSN